MREIRKANCFLLFMICFYVGGSYGIGWLNKYVELPYNLHIMSAQILIGLSLIAYFAVTRTNPFKVIRHKRLGIIDILLVLLFMAFMMPLTYFINYISMFFTENTTAAALGGMMNNPYWMNLLMLAVTPAVIEELVCRGIILHSYRKKSYVAAVLLSAFIFGLLHMNLNQMLYAAVIGIAFALAVEATDSIYSSMIMHFCMNSVSVTALAFLKFMEKLGLYSEEMIEQEMQAGVQLAVSPVITVILIAVALMVVIASTAIAVLILMYLVKRNNRTLKELFTGKCAQAKSVPTYTVDTMSDIEGNAQNLENIKNAELTQSKGIIGTIIDIPFVLAVVICFIVMLFL